MSKSQWIFLFVFLLIGPNFLAAQSYRYWGDQFGATASLLSGAVVGGDAGPSAIYYNPAQIENATDPILTLNSDVVGLEIINAKNALGRELNLKAFNLRVFPGFFSYQFQNKKNKRIKYEFAILTREENRYDINSGTQSLRDVPTVGESKYDASVDLYNDFKNLWMGFGAAYKINDKWSIGGSIFLNVKVDSYKLLIDANLFPLSDSTLEVNGYDRYFFSNATRSDRYRYFDVGLLGKVGVQYSGTRWNLGMNLTTPTLNLFGWGDIVRKVSFTNIPDENGGFRSDLILVDQQKKVDVRYKDPLSLSIGAQYKIFNSKRTSIYGTVEFFQEIEPYRVFETKSNDDIGPEELLDSLDTSNFLNVFNGNKPLANFAGGFGSHVSEKTFLMAGFRTDFNYRKGYREDILNSGFETSSLEFDVFHLTFGGVFNIQKSGIFTGLQLSFGNSNGLKQIADIDDEDDNNEPPLIGNPDRSASASYFALAIFFGFNIDVGQ